MPESHSRYPLTHFPSGRRLVWRAIARDSRSTVVVLHVTLTASRYMDDTLHSHLLPFLAGIPGVVFQQHNTRPHTVWPVRSADTSPIEHRVTPLSLVRDWVLHRNSRLPLPLLLHSHPLALRKPILPFDPPTADTQVKVSDLGALWRVWRSGEIRPALNNEVLRADEDENGRNWRSPRRPSQPVASSGTIPTCENPGATQPQVEPGSPRWEANSLTTTPPEEIWTAINSEVLRGDGAMRRVCSSAGMKGQGKREFAEKTHRPTASSGMIPTCENPVTQPGIEPGSPWWEASELTAWPPRPLQGGDLALLEGGGWLQWNSGDYGGGAVFGPMVITTEGTHNEVGFRFVSNDLAVNETSSPTYVPTYLPTYLKAVHDKVSSFEINIRRKSLLLPAYMLTGALRDMRPVKLVTMDEIKPEKRAEIYKGEPPRVSDKPIGTRALPTLSGLNSRGFR
ncbi:hypothetical protein PR048_014990 [Dryococelus australis]|uniref:Uncharacterized protein n=1 Tax=Dryococelus australis TaxID=614101 RepID=A0ABQ9HFX6_9NEOP|nr:hypothetical protein PR048_014990 [Dryococelus australis]